VWRVTTGFMSKYVWVATKNLLKFNLSVNINLGSKMGTVDRSDKNPFS